MLNAELPSYGITNPQAEVWLAKDPKGRQVVGVTCSIRSQRFGHSFYRDEFMNDEICALTVKSACDILKAMHRNEN